MTVEMAEMDLRTALENRLGPNPGRANSCP